MKNHKDECSIDFDAIFPDNREEGRNTLEQTQLVMLRLLKIFDYLCLQYNIKYFLIGGSSIGAIRHQGFIPWDDDIDVGMTRENYNLFLKKCVNKLPSDIFFQNPDTDKFYPKFDYVDAKLRDKYSSYKHNDEVSYKYHDGLQLDIFVFDQGFLPSKPLVILQNILINKLSRSLATREKVLALINKILPWKTVYSNNWLQKLGMMRLNTGDIYIRNSEINNLKRVPFADTMAYVPQDYDVILRRQFGDYMTLPPIEKQVSHHNVVVCPFKPCDHEQILFWEERG